MRRVWFRSIAITLFVPVFASVAQADERKVEFFEKQIRPLLINRCSKCHGARKQESGLRVDDRAAFFQGGDSGAAIQPGQAGNSLLLARVQARGDQQMPPDTRLSDQEIAALQKWIADGAVWPGDSPVTRPVIGVKGTGVNPIEANDPALRDSLDLWLRADTLQQNDGARVMAWPDASGRGHDLMITAGVRPQGNGNAPTFVAQSSINARPAVRFDRSSGLAGSPDHPLRINGDAEFTIILVARLTHDTAATHDSLLTIGNPAHQGDPGRPLAALIEIEPKTKKLDLAGGFSHDASLGPGSSQVLYDQPGMLTITRKRGPWTAGTSFWFNSEPSTSAWGREPTGTDAVPDVQHRKDVGVSLGRVLPWSRGFVGDLAEVIVFNRVLTDVERSGLEATLAMRHGLTVRSLYASAARTFSEAEKNFWAFQPVEPPFPPDINDGDWPSASIDFFMLAKLEAAGLRPASQADRRTLIRRATFDLTGLPPIPTEVDRFLADPEPDRIALAKLVNRLLESPHYGERWARHWLDVVRYAETTANDANAVMRYACQYRDYVIRSLNEDKPYDQFVIEQLAGDLIEGLEDEQRRDAVIATGFLMLGQKALAEADKEQSRIDIVDDQLDVTGRAFLGLTIGCARCHDHKFDPIPTVDYYSLAGILRSTEVFRDEVKGATMWQEWSLDVPGLEPLMVMAPREGTPVSLRVHRRGNRHNLGILTPRRFLQVIAGEDHQPVTTASSGRLELAQWIASKDNPLTARVIVNRIWQHHFGQGLVATSDNFGSRGETPSHPALLDWLAHDFVANGWSLKRLHRHLMVSSTWMQSSRPADDSAAEADPDNRLLSHMPLRRLDAESIRDAILLTSGLLDVTPGGNESGEFLYERGEVIDKNRDFFRPNRVEADDPYYTKYRRRSIYLPVVRNAVPDILTLFDGADPNGVVTKRNDTTVPAQALFLLNHPLIHEASQALAKNILESANDAERVAACYRRVLNREPTTTEVERNLEFLDEETAASDVSKLESDTMEAWTALCQTLFCRNEFLYVR